MDNLLSVADADDVGKEFKEPRVEVRGFGRISHASISTAPLTILVGKNNTGKSYIATLLWAIRDFNNTISNIRGPNRIDAPEWFASYVRSALKSKQPKPIEIFGEQVAEEINIWLAGNKDYIARKLLSFDEATIDELKISLSGSLWLRPSRHLPYGLRNAKFERDFNVSSWMFSWNKDVKYQDDDQLPAFITSSDKDDDRDINNLYALALQKFISCTFSGMMVSPLYIPAARTGLMLSLPSLVDSSFENFGLGDQKVSQGRFSLPTIRFIQQVARDRYSGPDNESQICKFLEENILRGTVIQDKENRARFSYAPAGSKTLLPLHATSSMVSELTPLLASLRRGFHNNGIIFEEPEAHLHLSAQRWMARAIAKLVNDGNKVTITTHSDTFIQQINLLIQLNLHPDRNELMKKYGYTKDELLSLQDVRAYEFVSNETGTNVEEVKKGNGGLVVNSLNSTLYSLAEEVFAVEAD
ncbi:AAA family ATPase [Methylorubrum aminovorans]